jgi:hypothetical protein
MTVDGVATATAVPDQLDYTQIMPSLESTATTFAYVVVMFTCYIMFVGYISSYDINYTPNFNMFVNFIFDNPDTQKNFEKYMAHHCGTKQGFVPSQKVELEPFVPETNSMNSVPFPETNCGQWLQQLVSDAKRNACLLYNQWLLQNYTKGNTIRFFRAN